MRYFFYSFCLILSLSLFVNDASADLSDQCPYGYRNKLTTSVNVGTNNSTSGSTYLQHRNKYNSYIVSDPIFVVTQTDEYGNSYYYATFDYVIPDDCSVARDQASDDGCYPTDKMPNSLGVDTCSGEETKTCYTSDGSTFQLAASKSCPAYCLGDDPNTVIYENAHSCVAGSGDNLSDDDPTDPGSNPDLTCPADYVLEGNECVGLADSAADCPPGYTFDFGECSGPPNTDPTDPDPTDPDPTDPDPTDPDPTDPDPTDPDPTDPDPTDPDPTDPSQSSNVVVDNATDITGPINSKLDSVIDAIGNIPGGGGSGAEPEPDPFSISIDGFGSLDERVLASQTEYLDQLAFYQNEFKDLFTLSDSSQNPFYDDIHDIRGASVNFGTTQIQSALEFLPQLILFLASVSAAFIMFRGISS